MTSKPQRNKPLQYTSFWTLCSNLKAVYRIRDIFESQQPTPPYTDGVSTDSKRETMAQAYQKPVSPAQGLPLRRSRPTSKGFAARSWRCSFGGADIAGRGGAKEKQSEPSGPFHRPRPPPALRSLKPGPALLP